MATVETLALNQVLTLLEDQELWVNNHSVAEHGEQFSYPSMMG